MALRAHRALKKEGHFKSERIQLVRSTFATFANFVGSQICWSHLIYVLRRVGQLEFHILRLAVFLLKYYITCKPRHTST